MVLVVHNVVDLWVVGSLRYVNCGLNRVGGLLAFCGGEGGGTRWWRADFALFVAWAIVAGLLSFLLSCV